MPAIVVIVIAHVVITVGAVMPARVDALDYRIGIRFREAGIAALRRDMWVHSAVMVAQTA